MDYTNLFYVAAAVLFILGIKRLSSPKTARAGNALASVGMLIAIVATVSSFGELDYKLIAIGMIIGSIIGATFALRVEMTQMPQMVAIFNGFGGGASALVATAEYFSKFGNYIPQYYYQEYFSFYVQDVIERVDCRHIDVCSVDPPGCTDIDDALHAFELPNGNYQVNVSKISKKCWD